LLSNKNDLVAIFQLRNLGQKPFCGQIAIVWVNTTPFKHAGSKTKMAYPNEAYGLFVDKGEHSLL
jgi:hypothetical protein